MLALRSSPAAAGSRGTTKATTTEPRSVYLTDVDEYLANGREIGRLWREMAGRDYPAMAGIGVSRLWQPEAKIEIKGVAVIGAGQA